ncbi:unnamed protein product [Brassica napus]|uniref:(rape) hypothetical protein n=1 Tax=Brassica napus TaxID=3708 RepID=A0A816IUZ9_BRANA|nr:unnamed protein product [Brassica napus]
MDVVNDQSSWCEFNFRVWSVWCECVGVREKIDNTFDRDSTVT